tara:strand:- start:817 stop:1503 length:687 start_codon:yes stop_codon:yes gene_type:complete
MTSISKPHHQHHFASSEQQYEAAKFGMWAFLVTEVLTFAGLFCAYAILRYQFPYTFQECSESLDATLGLINTIVLITSSLTMALAIYFIQNDDRKKTIYMLAATILFAIAFMVIKYFEYTHKFHVGEVPGENYNYTGIPEYLPVGCAPGSAGCENTNPSLYFSVYFMMTGLHGIHVIGGIVVIGFMMLNTYKGKYSSKYYTPIELTGLFWHLVDLVWIFLFPLLYLIG